MTNKQTAIQRHNDRLIQKSGGSEFTVMNTGNDGRVYLFDRLLAGLTGNRSAAMFWARSTREDLERGDELHGYLEFHPTNALVFGRLPCLFVDEEGGVKSQATAEEKRIPLKAA